MEFSHSPSKGRETKKKREKLKKRKERKRNDKWKESKAKNKKKIAFFKCIRNDSEPSSRLVNKVLSYGRGGSRIFLGGGALVSFSTSTPINHSFFFFCRIPVVLENRRSSQGERGVRIPCTLPLDPPLYGFVEKPENGFLTKCSGV